MGVHSGTIEGGDTRREALAKGLNALAYRQGHEANALTMPTLDRLGVA